MKYMKYSLSYENIPEYIYIYIHKNVDHILLKNISDELFLSHKWNDNYKLLINCSNDNKNTFLSLSNIEQFKRIISLYRNKLKESYCAIVVHELMYHPIVEIQNTVFKTIYNSRVKVFINESEAKTWLKDKY